MAVDPYAAVAARVYAHISLVLGAAVRHTVPPGMISAVIHLASCGDPDTFLFLPAGRGHCFGVMALPLSIARGLGYGGPVRMLFDSYLNIELGTQYLAVLLTRYRDPLLALIAWHSGPGAVRWYQLGWTYGRAVHFAKAALALQYYYERVEKAAPANG